ncbi:MAG: LacI family DNA-binding transcriptional regulator [Verrucomicrobia bacterium]|nr:LacI family DNA-binding transcriptional regulator [Verrucomicrobiota bacterium]
MNPPLRMRDIAQQAGVSVATVSKCLSGKRDVSAATRRRVLATCRRLGYRPNPLVAALMRSRRRHTRPSDTLTLAFVSAFPTADGWRRHPSPIFRQMFAGAEARARERNYRLEHFWLFREGMSNARFSQVLAARGIRGLLIAPVPDTETAIDLHWPDFSTVVLGLTPTTRNFHRVTTDYYQSMLLVMEECLKLGYRRPGLAARLPTIKRLEFRWEGAWLVACERFGLKTPPPPLFVDEWTPGAVERWLERERTDVVIGPVLGKLEEIIRASGRRIPGDLGVVGLLVPQAGDRLSGVLQDGEVIGAVAIDQLISAVERNETGVPEHPITHTILGRWNPGRTLRRIG